MSTAVLWEYMLNINWWPSVIYFILFTPLLFLQIICFEQMLMLLSDSDSIVFLSYIVLRGVGDPHFLSCSQEASDSWLLHTSSENILLCFLHGPVSVFPQVHAGGQRTVSPRYCLLSPQTTGSTIGVPRLGEDPWLRSDTSHYRSLFYKDICKLGSKVLV